LKTLKHLFDKNRAWASRIKEEDPTFFAQLSKQQEPEYLWIGCSDSRVPANQIVDLNPGEIFVHRNIANLVIHSDLNCQSVIQYSVEVLKVKHVIVCGHYGCGGVTAAMKNQKLGLIDNWIQNIKELYRMHKKEIQALPSESERINHLCELNVRNQVYNLCQSPFVQDAWSKGQELAVHGLIYGLSDGLLKNLNISVDSNKAVEKVFTNEKFV
jgi:carbonic anhydrase